MAGSYLTATESSSAIDYMLILAVGEFVRFDHGRRELPAGITGR